MPRLEVRSISENKYSYFRNVLNYVAKPEKCQQGYISATRLYLPKERKYIMPEVKKQIDAMREFYGKEEYRLGIHLIIEFSIQEAYYLKPQRILEIGHYIAQVEFANCMTYFALHDHSEVPHLDMLIVPINVLNGNMYSCGKAGWNAIELRLREYMKNYMPEEAIAKFQVSFGVKK